MSDTNVKIKLSADAGQVRSEIKLIDKELKQLGSSTPGSPRKGSNKSDDTTERVSRRPNKSSNSSQDSRDKIFGQLTRESQLIRKELQKMNGQNGGVGGTSVGGSSTPPPSYDSTSSTVAGSPSGGSDVTKGMEGKLGSVLGKLATAAVALKSVTSAWNYVSLGAQSSASGESLAYQTYGSTMAYTDYYNAKKDSKNLGESYGYDYGTVMNAGDINMSKSGFSTLESHESDMDSILGTSKAWGIDASRLASTSGTMTQLGVTENGGQKKFSDMLASSIVDAQMTGREDEQLQVLETISENLGRTLVKVDDSSLNSTMGLYTSIANNNSTLKGNRGASMVGNINDSIVNGSSTMDVLLGWGTEYTGVSGRVDLEKLKEEGLSNPETLSKVFNNFQKYTKKDIDSDFGKMFLHTQMGLSYSQTESLLKSKEEIMSGNYNSDLLTNKGSDATQSRLDNYKGSDVSTQEKYNIEKQDTKESFGEKFNNLFAPFRNMYSGLGEGGRRTVDMISGAGKVAAGVGGVKLAEKAGKGIWGGIKGASKGATSAAESGIKDVIKSSGSTAAGSVDDVAGGITKSGIAKGAGILGKAGKVVGGVGTIITLADSGYNAYQAHERNDNRKMSQEIGGGVGTVAGGWGGAAGGAALGGMIGSAVPVLGTAIGGAIGGVIGGIGGALGGGKVGKKAGEGVYDISTGGDSYNWTDEQKQQIQKYSSEVSKLYGEKGNNAAQKYTNRYVSPYLNSLGVSTSVTDKYNKDVGKPDFLKDAEKNLFGNMSSTSGVSAEETSSVLDNNTEATKDLTAQLEELNGKRVLGNGVQIRPENNDELLGKLNKDERESKFKLWNPSTWNSHAVGNDYIPHDNYKAQLHKGEMVLNKLDADDYRQGKSNNSSSQMSGKLELNVNLNGDVSGITKENQNRIVSVIVEQLSTSGFQNLIANGFTRVQNY